MLFSIRLCCAHKPTYMQTRFREHTKTQGPMRYHLQQCNTTLTDDNVDILASTSRGEGYLMTLEALWIQELEPTINTKDEYKSRTLSIKLSSAPTDL